MNDDEPAEWITTIEAADLLDVHVDNARKALRAMECETRSGGIATLWRRADVLAVRDLRQFRRVSRNPAASVPRPQYNGPDYCDEAGAQRLKERIEEYWRARGLTVAVQLVEAGWASALRVVRVDIRSDMVDGLPRK